MKKTGSRVNWKPVGEKRTAVARRPVEEEAPAPTEKKQPKLVTKPKPKAKPKAKAPVADPAPKKKLIKRTGQVPPVDVPKKAKPKDDLIVIHESDTKKTRVVLLRSPAEGDRPEMVTLRQQFRREGQTDWQFSKVGISMVCDVETLRRLRQGVGVLLKQVEDEA